MLDFLPGMIWERNERESEMWALTVADAAVAAGRIVPVPVRIEIDGEYVYAEVMKDARGAVFFADGAGRPLEIAHDRATRIEFVPGGRL